MPTSVVFQSIASIAIVVLTNSIRADIFTRSWMVSRGARNFIFLSRSGTDKPEAAALVEELHELARATYPDLSVQVIRGDVSVRDDVARAISCAKKPIKGVVQAAMVLKVRCTLWTLDEARD